VHELLARLARMKRPRRSSCSLFFVLPRARMKRPRGGSLFLVLAPDELLARLATLVPPPRIHGVR